MSGHRYEPKNEEPPLEESPFYDLFMRHAWLPPTLILVRRLMGTISEFLAVHVKPFLSKPNKK